MKVNLYDFDDTIYNGDSMIDFYFFTLIRKPKIIRYLPRQLVCILKYKFKKIKKEEMKENFYSFIKDLNKLEEWVEYFWTKKKYKIKGWYLDKNHENDIIVSASPYFMLEGICKELNVKDLIATNLNPNTIKIEGKNCHGEEKVRRIYAKYKKLEVLEAYSDSLSDMPMLELALNAYIVKKNKIIKIGGNNEELH